jgi:hypothetical protein
MIFDILGNLNQKLRKRLHRDFVDAVTAGDFPVLKKAVIFVIHKRGPVMETQAKEPNSKTWGI